MRLDRAIPLIPYQFKVGVDVFEIREILQNSAILVNWETRHTIFILLP